MQRTRVWNNKNKKQKQNNIIIKYNTNNKEPSSKVRGTSLKSTIYSSCFNSLNQNKH